MVPEGVNVFSHNVRKDTSHILEPSTATNKLELLTSVEVGTSHFIIFMYDKPRGALPGL